MSKAIPTLKVFVKKYINSNTNDITPEFKLLNLVYFKDVTFRFGKSVSANELEIKCFDMGAIQNYFLIFDDEIKIFKWSENIKLVKTIKSHLFIFLLKTKKIEKIKDVLYNILLTLYSQNIEKFESYFEKILIFLKVQNILEMVIKNNHLLVKRIDGSYIFNNKLQSIEFLVDDLKKNKILNYKTTENSLKIFHKDISFNEEIILGEYKKILFIENCVVVLLNESIKIFKFYD